MNNHQYMVTSEIKTAELGERLQTIYK
jgi:hypothetical protein